MKYNGVLRHNCCHICLRTDDARVTLPHPKHNTPLSDEEQVWDVSGIVIGEPEKDLKWRIQFQLHFGDSFQSKVTFAWPWSSWRQQCRTSQTSWTKEEKCSGRPDATSADKPWKGVERRGVTCCRFRSWFEKLKHLRFGGSLSFICETGNPTASWRSMHFRGSFAEVAPGRPEHFSTAVHRACEVLYCRLQLFQGEASVDQPAKCSRNFTFNSIYF